MSWLSLLGKSAKPTFKGLRRALVGWNGGGSRLSWLPGLAKPTGWGSPSFFARFLHYFAAPFDLQHVHVYNLFRRPKITLEQFWVSTRYFSKYVINSYVHTILVTGIVYIILLFSFSEHFQFFYDFWVNYANFGCPVFLTTLDRKYFWNSSACRI
jgi:hypothetical protein